MFISKENMLISIVGGVLAFAVTAPLIQVFSLIVGPSIAILLWVYYIKKEKNE